MKTMIGSMLAIALLAGCNTVAQHSEAPSAQLIPTSESSSQSNEAGAMAYSQAAQQQNSRAGGEQRPVNPLVQTGMASTPASFGNLEYRLNPLDVVEISVFQVPELTQTVQVNSGGQINLPLIGGVTAGGRTVSELEQEIAHKLGERYLQSPQVSVFVREYNSQQVTVEGAVNSPGVYQIAGGASLLKVLAMAKGLDRVADPGGVMIFRNNNGNRVAAVFDVRAIRTGRAPDPRVVGGDIVVVDQSATRTAWRDVRESIGVLGAFVPFF